MTPERVLALPEVPPAVEDLRGLPRFGTYQGEFDIVALDRLRGPYELPLPFRVLKHKKWTYVQVSTPEVVAAFAIVHLTYTSNAWVTAVDLRTRAVLFDESFLGLPGTRAFVGPHPGDGLQAFFKRPGAEFHISRGRRDDRYRFDVYAKPLLPFSTELTWSGELVTLGAPPALSVVAPVAGDGVVNVTQKRAAMLSLGTLKVGRQTFSLDGGAGGMDYTSGYLARKTQWRWAMGNGRLDDGTACGFNLVEGFNDQNARCNENAFWVADQLFPLPRAKFRYDREDPSRPWEVETVDGSVSLRFQPLHVHREARDYRVVKSRFVQPLGQFTGTVRVGGRTLRVENLGGVTEDQDILW